MQTDSRVLLFNYYALLTCGYKWALGVSTQFYYVYYKIKEVMFSNFKKLGN